MSSLRSEDMKMVQLFIQNDAAIETLRELGHLGAIQFQDLNPTKTAFQRTFVNQVRQCEEMERILRFLHIQVVNMEVKTNHGAFAPPDSQLSRDELASRLEEYEKELLQLNTSFDTMTRQRAEVAELREVLSRCGKFFTAGRAPLLPSAENPGSALLEDEAAGGASLRLGFIAGLIPSEKVEQFGRVLFRSTRGNMILRSEHLNEQMVDPKSGELTRKAVFIVFFSGERAQQKIARICDTFGASRHPFPERPQEQHAVAAEVETRMQDLEAVIESTKTHRYTIVARLALSLDAWFDQVRRDKAIFHTMNMFNYDITHKCLIAEGWCPDADIGKVREALERAREASGAHVATVLNVIATRDTPPTFFRSNKFTTGFQAIVDAYGTARYKEFNPAVFAVITFPFLFGVMFGDAGHGLIMFLIALYMVRNEKKIASKKLNEMVDTLFQGRYIVLLMGVFAFYCGCVYNETFSIANQAAPSQWEEPHGDTNATMKALKEGVVYPFGVDPGWAHTGNKLGFYNSLKMKMSIILGITQMVAGVVLKLSNCLFFQDKLTMLFVFIPEIVFINSIFGYLCIAIFIKWGTNYDYQFVLNNARVVTIDHAHGELAQYVVATKSNPNFVVLEGKANLDLALKNPLLRNETSCFEHNLCSLYKQPPPSLLDMLIKMFMSPGHIVAENSLYSGQAGVQVFLVLIALLCVPVLLLGRPLMLRRQMASAHGGFAMHHDEEEADDEESRGGAHGGGHGGEEEGEEHHEFSEIMIHQIIHTIEYVLGCISSTASYLRLWALSLAHAQLSEVFWERLVVMALEANSIPLIFATVGAWSCLTFAVLMGMESLSAFLHALRLHWVEFQGKFYFADGVRYIPFDFAALPQGADAAEIVAGGDE